MIKTIPKKKKCRKAKWLSEEALQIAEKRRETKGKGEKGRYTKETFHANMGIIKERSGMDLQKQKILRRGGKNIQKNYTKMIFTTKIIMMVLSLT